MTHQKTPRRVPPATVTFRGGISHPDLWLWDCWTEWHDARLHLYCLSVSRINKSGEPIHPHERNDYPFEIRHFVSDTHGESWTDKGALLAPGTAADGSDMRNVWSGSVLRRSSGQWLFGYTGIRDAGPDRNFLQTICLATGPDSSTVGRSVDKALSCPLRDYDDIIAAGYYLGPEARLGENDGEEGGPILAWRDPFVFQHPSGGWHIIWSAKVGPKTPAVAHATLIEKDGNFQIDKLLPPLTLPDADALTQAEVPRLYHDAKRDLYYLLISACNRLYEGQPDDEVSKLHRLYKSTSIDGPWLPYCGEGSLLPELPDLFGASLVSADFDTGDFGFLAPYTEMARPDLRLTFAPIKLLNIYKARSNAVKSQG